MLLNFKLTNLILVSLYDTWYGSVENAFQQLRELALNFNELRAHGLRIRFGLRALVLPEFPEHRLAHFKEGIARRCLTDQSLKFAFDLIAAN